MLREVRDLAPVGGHRFLGPVEPGQDVAAEVGRSLELRDVELARRAAPPPRRSVEPPPDNPGGALHVGQEQQRRGLPVALSEGGLGMLLGRLGALLLECDAGEQLVRFARMSGPAPRSARASAASVALPLSR